MSRFVTEMDGMFGSQMQGMNEMLVQTASTIQDASRRFEQLANQIQQAGSGAADAMSKRLEEALLNMQNAQASSNEQMRMFVEQLKQNITQGQSESSELTKNLVKELSESTTALVRSLQDQSNSAQSAHDDRQKERDEQMNRLLEHLKENISNTQAESANATTQLLGMGRAVKHAGQTTLYLTPMHAAKDKLMRLITNIRAALGHVRAVAEQLPGTDRWSAFLAYVVAKITRPPPPWIPPDCLIVTG